MRDKYLGIEAPPRDGEYGDRMHQILSIAAASPNPLYSLWGRVYTWADPKWLNWLVENGYLKREGEYLYYPEDGPIDRITAKGRLWLMAEGHKGRTCES